MKSHLSFPRAFAVVAVLAAVGAASAATTAIQTTGRPSGARLSSTEVVRIAKRAASRHGYKLKDFEPPEVFYNFAVKDDSWAIFFHPVKPAAPGEDFMVIVKDKTAEAKVWPGQ